MSLWAFRLVSTSLSWHVLRGRKKKPIPRPTVAIVNMILATSGVMSTVRTSNVRAMEYEGVRAKDILATGRRPSSLSFKYGYNLKCCILKLYSTERLEEEIQTKSMEASRARR